MKKKPITNFPVGCCVVDFETTGLSPYEGCRAFICGLEDETGQVILARPGTRDWKRAQDIFENPSIEKVAHGAKFEIKHAYHLGWRPSGRFHDTMGLAVLANEYTKLSLDALSQRYLNDDSKGIVKEWLTRNTHRIRKETGREPNYLDVPPELIELYLTGDLDKTMRLQWMWGESIESTFPDLYHMETDLGYDIAKMEDHGIHIDMPYVQSEIKRLRPEMLNIEKGMSDMIGVNFNPASRFDLTEVMESLGLDTGTRNKDNTMKTDFKNLELLPSSPFVDQLVRWRGLSKILGTYLIPFTQSACGDVVHGSFWQFGTEEGIVTGRMSASNPNLQNIPGGGRSTNKVLIELGPIVRRAIVPPPGMGLVFFDYKQIEMVIFTCYAQDRRAMSDLINGVDPYIAQGKLLYGANAFEGMDEDTYTRKRFEAKELCLSLIYGMGLGKMARRMRLSKAEAKQRRDQYFANSPKTRDFMMQTMRDLLVNGHVTDRFGRRYHVPQEMAYKSVNALCQGSAASVMKQGIIRARPLVSLGFRPIMVIHDELVGFAPLDKIQEVAYEGCRLLRDPNSFEVPIEVTVKWSPTNWADKLALDE